MTNRGVFLPLAEIGAAVHDKHVVAVLAVGPMGPGEVVDVVGAIKLATKGAPGILAIDEADAINKRFPGLEFDRRARRSLPRAAAHPR